MKRRELKKMQIGFKSHSVNNDVKLLNKTDLLPKISLDESITKAFEVLSKTKRNSFIIDFGEEEKVINADLLSQKLADVDLLNDTLNYLFAVQSVNDVTLPDFDLVLKNPNQNQFNANDKVILDLNDQNIQISSSGSIGVGIDRSLVGIEAFINPEGTYCPKGHFNIGLFNGTCSSCFRPIGG